MKATKEELDKMSFPQILDQFETKVRDGGKDIRPEYGILLARYAALEKVVADYTELLKRSLNAQTKIALMFVVSDPKKPADIPWQTELARKRFSDCDKEFGDLINDLSAALAAANKKGAVIKKSKKKNEKDDDILGPPMSEEEMNAVAEDADREMGVESYGDSDVGNK